MSADPHASHGEIEMPHASMRDYVIGFILSVILTAIPFWLVIERPFGAGATAAIIMVFAMIQIVVQMVFFLHMTPKAEGGWSLTSLVFTVIVVVIMLAGSLWVMHHLNTNMMPPMHDTSQLP